MTIWEFLGMLMQTAVDAIHDVRFFWGIDLWDFMVGIIAIWDLSLILGDVFGSNDAEDEEDGGL